MTAFDEKKISCPRCIYLLKTAKTKLKIITKIKGKNVMSICSHCRRTLASCGECDRTIKQFLITRNKCKSKQCFKKYMSKINSILNEVVSKRKRVDGKYRTYSDVDISNVQHNSPISPIEQEIGVVFDSKTMKYKSSCASLDSKYSKYTKKTKKRIKVKENKLLFSQSLQNIAHDSNLPCHNEYEFAKFEVLCDFKTYKDKLVQEAEFENSLTDRKEKSTNLNLKVNRRRKSMPDMPMKEFDKGSFLPLSEVYNSDENSLKLNAISSDMDIISNNNFKYYFPTKVDNAQEQIHKYISSYKLIRNTQNMLQDQEITKSEADQIKKHEEKEKKYIEPQKKKKRENEQLRAEEEFREHIVVKKYTDNNVKIVSIKEKQEKTLSTYAKTLVSKFQTSNKTIKLGELKEIGTKERETKHITDVSKRDRIEKDIMGTDSAMDHLKRDMELVNKTGKSWQKHKNKDGNHKLGELNQTDNEEFSEQRTKLGKEGKDVKQKYEVQKHKDVSEGMNKGEQILHDTENRKHRKSSKYTTKDNELLNKEREIKDRKVKSHTSNKISKVTADGLSKKEKESQDATLKPKHGGDLKMPSVHDDNSTKKEKRRNDVKIDINIQKAANGKEKNDELDRKAPIKGEHVIDIDSKATGYEFKKLLAEQIKQKESEKKRKKMVEETQTKPREIIDETFSKNIDTPKSLETKQTPPNKVSDELGAEKVKQKVVKQRYNKNIKEEIITKAINNKFNITKVLNTPDSKIRIKTISDDIVTKKDVEETSKSIEDVQKTGGATDITKSSKAKIRSQNLSAPPSPTAKSKTGTDLDIAQIKMKRPSGDDLMLKLVKLHQSVPRKTPSHKQTDEEQVSKLIAQHLRHKNNLKSNCIICAQSDIDLELESLLNNKETSEKITRFIIIGEKIYKYKAPMKEISVEEQIKVFKWNDDNIENVDMEGIPPTAVTTKSNKTIEQEPPKGIIRYALSDRSFIDKGWTLLPTEKVVRKMNVYRMHPAHPEFDWFEHNKCKRLMQYDSGEKLAEFSENGRGRWFYKNGRVALDYYDAEETNAQQRFVVYSSGEPDERGRSRLFTILATFDYLGNGVVFDHTGKIRLKYNQTEGVVLDRTIGPVSHWKWHTLNDPPVLQQVMIDTQMPYKDSTILKLGKNDPNKPRPDNEDMLAIEFDNFIKEKSKKLSQAFKPFQIKMKALKINEQFSLKVLDQATVYLIFRDGSANLKLNLGMILDHKEIVDTDTAEVGEVSNTLERLPARTDSIAGLQSSIAHAQHVERLRLERERRLRPAAPSASVDQLVAATSRPMRLPLRTVPSDTSVSCSCKCMKPSSNLYYDTRLV